MSEQRRSERIFFRVPVQYRLTAAQEPKGCLALDYSSAGIRLRAQDFIPVNTSILMELISPARQLLQITGKVVWVQQIPHGEMYQVGVQFEKPPQEAVLPERSPRFSY